MQFNHVPNSLAETLAQRIVGLRKTESRSVLLHRTYGEENHQFEIQLGVNDQEVMGVVAKLESDPEDWETSATWLPLEHAIPAIEGHIQRTGTHVYYSPVDLAPIQMDAILRAILEVMPSFGQDVEFNIWSKPGEELNIRAKNLHGQPDAGLSVRIPFPKTGLQ